MGVEVDDVELSILVDFPLIAILIYLSIVDAGRHLPQQELTDISSILRRCVLVSFSYCLEQQRKHLVKVILNSGCEYFGVANPQLFENLARIGEREFPDRHDPKEGLQFFEESK